MNIQELEERSGVPARLIRFLISESVIPKPSGGRKFATYSDEHVEALSVYSRLKAKGVSQLEVIRQEVISGPRVRRFKLAEGVELEVRTDFHSASDALAKHLLSATKEFFKGE